MSASRFRPVRRGSLLLACLLLVPMGCGGGGGSNPNATSVTVGVASPVGQITTGADRVTIRGNASSPDGVASVSVAGIAAQTADDFANWTVVAELEPGDNLLPIVVEDSTGRVGEAARLQVRRVTSLLDRSDAFAVVPDGSRLYFPELELTALIEVDRATGVQRIAAQGAPLRSPGPICFDPTGTLAYVSEIADDSIVEVVLSTGAMRVVSSNGGNPGTPNISSPEDMLYDLGHGPARLLLVDPGQDAITAIEIDTGARSFVSALGNRGAGPGFQFPRGICWSGPDTVLVGDTLADQIYEVNVVSGDRTIIGSDTVGSGEAIRSPSDFVATNNPDVFFYTDTGLRALIQLNRATGARTLLADSQGALGSDQGAWFRGRDVELDPVSGDALVWDDVQDQLYRVTPAGARTLEYGERVGEGATIDNLRDIRWDSGTGRLVLAGTSPSRIVALDPATGDREILWTDGDPGPRLLNPLPVAIVEPGSRYVVADNRELFSLDLATRTMRSLAPDDPGFGPQLTSFTRQIHFEPTTGLLLVTDGVSLFSVDPISGQRQLRTPAGLFRGVTGLAVDPILGRVYVLDRNNQELLMAPILDSAGEVRDGIWPFQTANNGLEGNELSMLLEEGGTTALLPSRSSVDRLDLVTGQRTVVTDLDAGAPVGAGLPFTNGAHMAFLQGGNGALLDSFSNTVIVVDTVTGDRSVIAR